MSENYTNNNILEFTKADLPISLSKPTDGDLFFYGWYYNNDTSKEITQITIDLDGVGYGDIELSGYFSTKIMSSVTFDANGHSDYFENLESYNIVTSSPSEVVLPTSSKDSDYSSLYYLKGWTYVKDDANTIFDPSLDSFNSQNVTLYALWGTKIKINYYNDSYGSSNNSILEKIYCYPGQKVQIRNLDGVSENKEVHATDDRSYEVFGVSKWQYENSTSYYEPESLQSINGSDGTTLNLYPLFDTLISTYYKISISHTATYGDSGDHLGNKVTLTVSYGNENKTYNRGDAEPIFILKNTTVTISVSESYNGRFGTHETKLVYPGGSSIGYEARTKSFSVTEAGEIILTNN